MSRDICGFRLDRIQGSLQCHQNTVLLPFSFWSGFFCPQYGRFPAYGGKGDFPQLQTYVALTASLLRSVSADTLGTSPGPIFWVSVACLRWPYDPWTYLCRGILYSGQTWVRDSLPMVSFTEIVCSKNGVCWFPREMLKIKNGNSWQQDHKCKYTVSLKLD